MRFQLTQERGKAMTLQRMLAWLIALATCWALVACGGDDKDGGTDLPDRIHVLAAPTGQLLPDAPVDGVVTGWTLVLQDPHPDAFWYADRPHREHGSTALADYVGPDWSRAYGAVDPNATLHFQLAGSDALEGAYLRLSEPSYDASARRLRFRAAVVANSATRLEPVPLDIVKASLNVLNNAASGQADVSYVQYAANAALQPTSAAGQYRLVLSGVDARTRLVSNAPAQYYELPTSAEFVAQWRGRFEANPPNVAVVGTPASGGLRLEFLTLSDPVYDQASGQLSYAASLLDQSVPPMGPLAQVILSIDSGPFSRWPEQGKGIAYQAFGHGYNPGTANSTNIYFGSDIARKQFGSLWGTQSYLLQDSCQPHCRNDLQTMKNMGVNLIRLYDWDPRNDHSQFLDHAHSLGIKVIVPISNWLATQPSTTWEAALAAYFTHGNFGNATEGDWHPAIAGVSITNELELFEGGRWFKSGTALVVKFLETARSKGYSKDVLVGMSVSFAALNGKAPAWEQFDQLLQEGGLSSFMSQLMLNPNSYNDRNHLFGTPGQPGWVQKTYERYKLPILFTEIGQSRYPGSNEQAQAIIKGQLEGTLEYQRAHPEQLLGAIHFQFSNKVWKQSGSDDGTGETDSEGAFGAFRHGPTVKTVHPVENDFNHWEAGDNHGTIQIPRLLPTATHDTVVKAYR